MKTATKTLLATATATLFALGAANAYAIDASAPAQSTEAVTAQTWFTPKQAVSQKSAVIRVDDALPDLVVPLDTSLRVETRESARIRSDAFYNTTTDLREFDLVEDSPLFIGAQGPTEFDTLEARRDSGSYFEEMEVVPLFPVAGAGLATSF